MIKGYTKHLKHFLVFVRLRNTDRIFAACHTCSPDYPREMFYLGEIVDAKTKQNIIEGSSGPLREIDGNFDGRPAFEPGVRDDDPLGDGD